MPNQQTAGRNVSQRSQLLGTSPALSQHIDASTGGDIGIPSSLSIATTSHLLHATHPTHGPQNTTQSAAVPENPFLSTPWLRTTQHIEDVSLLRTPSSLTSVGGASEVPALQGHLDGSLSNGLPHPTSVASESHNSTGILAELSPSYHQTAQYHPTGYHDPSVNMSTFVDMDGYARPRRQRIAPDLDALFDELASLDGAEK